MRKSLKAALFSGLVFPGSGHFVLRKYVRGGLLAGISIACLYALVSIAVEIAQEISDQILSGEIPLDAARITHEVTSRSAGDGSRLANLSTYLLVACWLVGIVDSWRVGRLLDKSESSAKSESQHEES